jgi:thiosulfate/3-mercaptopyruvate sulfurtransferase
MKVLRLLLSFVFLGLWIETASAQALVSVDWVKGQIGKPSMVFLDMREQSLYQLRHIPGAINHPYVFDSWRVRPLGNMNPRRTEQLFDARMSELGISNDSHVVLIHSGRAALDVAGSAFVYWHFKLLGHDRVSIMNGGMVAYTLAEGEVETYYRSPDLSDYKSKMRNEGVARLADVEAALLGGGAFIDYRTGAYFLGVNKLDEVARYGTLPGAKNLPADWLTLDGGGIIRNREQLRKLYDLREIQVGLPHIAFSSTAELASLGWFVASEVLGNKNALLYEASMREWAANPKNRMQRSVNLD